MKTQKQLVIEYVEEHGSILPAKIAGIIYQGVMFGSETSKRCRELRKDGVLISEKDGKFERYYLRKPEPKAFVETVVKNQEVIQPTLMELPPIISN